MITRDSIHRPSVVALQGQDSLPHFIRLDEIQELVVITDTGTDEQGLDSDFEIKFRISGSEQVEEGVFARGLFLAYCRWLTSNELVFDAEAE